jgi:hypothetical protein
VNAAAADLIAWDVLYFAASQKQTSKYTLTAPVRVSRDIRGDNATRVIVAASGVTVVADDSTAQSIDGLNEILINDQSVSTAEGARSEAINVLNAQGWDVTCDPIVVDYLDPGDMYNVVLGDTLTVSCTNAGLSSAKRTLEKRVDSLTEAGGWRTRLYLSATYPEATKNRILGLLEMSKRKRY